MGGAWRMTADPRGKKTVTPMLRSLALMAMLYCLRSIPPKRRHGDVRCLPSRRDAVCGSSHAI
jgi:hypothetical protein